MSHTHTHTLTHTHTGECTHTLPFAARTHTHTHTHTHTVRPHDNVKCSQQVPRWMDPYTSGRRAEVGWLSSPHVLHRYRPSSSPNTQSWPCQRATQPTYFASRDKNLPRLAVVCVYNNYYSETTRTPFHSSQLPRLISTGPSTDRAIFGARLDDVRLRHRDGHFRPNY